MKNKNKNTIRSRTIPKSNRKRNPNRGKIDTNIHNLQGKLNSVVQLSKHLKNLIEK